MLPKHEIEKDLAGFYGTEQYYKTPLYHQLGGLVYTDGVRYLARSAEAYWLIDAISSWQRDHDVNKESFQLWELIVKDKSGVLTMRSDSGRPAIVTQNIGYTTFPLDEIKLYVTDNVILLPSEY